MKSSHLPILALFLGLSLFDARSSGDEPVELVVLNSQNASSYLVSGKEADAIYGDFAFRNQHLSAVVALPAPNRHANMTVRDVSGCLIDFTTRTEPNDQLSAYYPGGGVFHWQAPEVSIDEQKAVPPQEDRAYAGKTIRLRFQGTSDETPLQASLTYELTQDRGYLLVEQSLRNPTENPVTWEPRDAIRTDGPFRFTSASDDRLFLTEELWWDQALGFYCRDRAIQPHTDSLERRRPIWLYKSAQTAGRDPSSELVLKPNQEETIRTLLFAARDPFAVYRAVAELEGRPLRTIELVCRDESRALRRARVTLRKDDASEMVVGAARTDREGRIQLSAPDGDYQCLIEAHGCDGKTIPLRFGPTSPARIDVSLPQPGFVHVTVTDADDQPIPSKVQFIGISPTENPHFGPDTYVRRVHNLVYTEDGDFRQAIAPGRYRVVASYGPEFEIATQEIMVARGATADVRLQLTRSLDTKGWISADFHSHSSPSGDNTSSQLGRVLNLLAEHIEFAPCTEHNRVSTYVPHLKRLGGLKRMGTCSGIELTGQPLPVNHQNAFPLRMQEHQQDGGGPSTDINPLVQIERLALWDDGSEKLVQGNHPDLKQIMGDRDLDDKPDDGFRPMFGFMDVVEVHPPHQIFEDSIERNNASPMGNTILLWMQMLNMGYRIPGVVNTDAHYNFHGSGWLRNYLYVERDDPATIDPQRIVTAAERGNLVMTNGPFLSVTARPVDNSTARALPGDDLVAPKGRVELAVRIQCPNWFDIDRVQVFVNGEPKEQFRFLRRVQPKMFTSETTRFDQTIPISLESDAHLIVATIGESSQLGEVMGPDHGIDRPVAVANPIFVDMDGNGFQANGALLPQLSETERRIFEDAMRQRELKKVSQRDKGLLTHP